MKKKNRLGRVLYFGVTLSFLVPIVYLILRMVFGGGEQASAGMHSESDYVLMLMQCVLGLITIHLPGILERRLRFELPGLLYGFYIVFLYCAISWERSGASTIWCPSGTPCVTFSAL